MRRINPFDAGTRDNFPILSPLKPPPQSDNKDLSYGPSDGESSSSYDDEEGMDVYGDDFDDDEDVVIDAGGSSGSENGANTQGKVKKNIELDWSIDTLATVKPAEISINDEYSTDEDLVSPTKLQIKRVKEEEIQRKSTEYFEKGKFTTTPKEIHTKPVQQRLYPPEEDKEEYSDSEEDDLNMRTPIKYGRERTYDEEIADVNMSISNLQKKFQDLLESADSSSDTALSDHPAEPKTTNDDLSELEELSDLDADIDRDLDRDYRTLPSSPGPTSVKAGQNANLASDDDDVQFGSDLELDSDLDLDEHDLDAHHLASLNGKPMTSTPMKLPLVALNDRKLEEENIENKKEEKGEKETETKESNKNELRVEKLVDDAGSELSDLLDESISDVSDLDQDPLDEQQAYIPTAAAPRVTSSFLTQLDDDEDSDPENNSVSDRGNNSDPGNSTSLNIHVGLDANMQNRLSPTSMKTTKESLPEIHSDSDLDDLDMENGKRNSPLSATPISVSSPIFSSSPIPTLHSLTPLEKKVDSTPFQSTPSTVEKSKNTEEPKSGNRFNVINQITPIKSVTTPSSPITLSTPTSATPIAAPDPTSPFFKLQSTPSHGQNGADPSQDIIGNSFKNSAPKSDQLASSTAGLPPLRQAASAKPEVRKQLDMDVEMRAAGPKLERRDLDVPDDKASLQDAKSGPQNAAKPPAHGLAPIASVESPKFISGKSDLANLLGKSPLKKTGFTYNDSDIEDIQELGGDFVDHETGEVFEQKQPVGTPWKQRLEMQEKEFGFSPIKGIMHNKDYFGPIAAEHEEDEEELMPNILDDIDESGNETTIIDEGNEDLVDEGEVDARSEKERHSTYKGIKQSLASNDEILRPQNGRAQSKSGDDDISAIIAKYVNLKHPPPDSEIDRPENGKTGDGAPPPEVSGNSAEAVRRRLAERDKELAEILADDDVLRDGRSTLSTSALRSIRDDYLKAPYTRTRYSSSYIHSSSLRSHSGHSRYSPIARPVSPEHYRYEPSRYSNAQSSVYMPPYTPPPYPTYTPPSPYSPTFRHLPYVPSYTSYTSYTPSYSSSYSSFSSYAPSYTPSYTPSYSPASYTPLRATTAYTPSPSPLPSQVPYSPPRYSSSPSLPSSHAQKYSSRLSSFAPLPPSSSLSSSVYYPSSISYTASKYTSPAKYP